MSEIVNLEGVHCTFGDFVALEDVNLSIRSNELFTLLGPSGCGKTTLLRILAGFQAPSSGHVVIGGERMERIPPNRRPVNMVFQSYAVFPHMTVAGNVAYGLKMERRPSGEIAREVEGALKMVRLEGFEHRKPDQLSGGQRQRVALARALVKKPKLLLLDEPLSALDSKLRTAMRSELIRLQESSGIAFVMVTHDQEEAMGISTRMAVMNEGRVQQVGTPSEIYENPSNVFVADFIGEANILPVQCTGSGCEIMDVGQELTLPVPPGFEGGRGAYKMMVRPENLVFGDGALGGTIADRTYLGSDVLFEVELGAHLLKVRVRCDEGAALPARGSSVRMDLKMDSVRLLKDER